MVIACFVLPTPSAQYRPVAWVIGPLIVAQYSRFYCSFFLPAVPPSLGTGGDLSILATPTVAQDCVTLCALILGDLIPPRPPLAKVVALLRFFAFPSTHSRPAPPQR